MLPFRTVGIKALQGFIQEWASPDFHNLYEQPMLWLLFGLLAVVGLSGRRWDWSDLTVVLVFGYSAFLARRNIAPLALVTAPVLARQAAPIVEAVSSRIRLPASARQDLKPGLSSALNWLIVILVALAALLKCGMALVASDDRQGAAADGPGSRRRMDEAEPRGRPDVQQLQLGRVLGRGRCQKSRCLWMRAPTFTMTSSCGNIFR